MEALFKVKALWGGGEWELTALLGELHLLSVPRPSACRQLFGFHLTHVDLAMTSSLCLGFKPF